MRSNLSKIREPRLSVRVSAALKQRVKRVERLAKMDEADTVRNSVEAYCDYVESHGGGVTPCKMVADQKPLTYPKAGSNHDAGLKVWRASGIAPPETKKKK